MRPGFLGGTLGFGGETGFFLTTRGDEGRLDGDSDAGDVASSLVDPLFCVEGDLEVVLGLSCLVALTGSLDLVGITTVVLEL